MVESTEYDGKLVRTKLRKKILADHPGSAFSELAGVKLKQKLKKKLIEEAHEFLAGETEKEEREELGDVLEVIETLFKLELIDKEKVQKAKQEKHEEKGGFEEGVYWHINQK